MTRAPAFVLVGVALVACGDDGASRPLTFVKRTIDPAFRAEGVAVFDVNNDRNLDLVTRELWYAGPTFTPHEVRTPQQWDPITEYSECFAALHDDVNRDGYEDLIVVGFPGQAATWCENPQGADQHWSCSQIVAMASSESPLMTDALGTSSSALVTNYLPDQSIALWTPADNGTWSAQPVTEPGFAVKDLYWHGLGQGDLNGDGRADLLTGSGWLEQPAAPTVGPWVSHPADFCPNNCADMFAVDLDGDARNDVIGSSPHGYGIWWWRHEADGSFTKTTIDDTISQTHSLRVADFDGDGLPELVTGKRWRAHGDNDPGASEPVLLVIYKARRQGDSLIWDRIEVDPDAGIGTQFEVVDVNADGKLDIVVANKKGLNYFEQQ
jgi:hypothetical protein